MESFEANTPKVTSIELFEGAEKVSERGDYAIYHNAENNKWVIIKNLLSEDIPGQTTPHVLDEIFDSQEAAESHIDTLA